MYTINLKQEITSIAEFLKKTFEKTGKKNAVLAWSGGIDSTTSLFLLAKALPIKNITVLHLPFETSHEEEFADIAEMLTISPSQFHTVSIRHMVETTKANLNVEDPIRLGNVMARMRMIVIYDCAKKLDALVCGTENKTEELLGYFTRFGDAASDIEPIRHLYKAQVYALANELGVPKTFIRRSPSAELWEGQTDEGEFGFTYAEADEILFRYFEQKMSIKEIEQTGFKNAEKIIALVKRNAFKHEVPYSL